MLFIRRHYNDFRKSSKINFRGKIILLYKLEDREDIGRSILVAVYLHIKEQFGDL